MKNAVFWDVAPCRSCVNRRFGETPNAKFSRNLNPALDEHLFTTFAFPHVYFSVSHPTYANIFKIENLFFKSINSFSLFATFHATCFGLRGHHEMR
jgi:hypothetical protein